MDKIGKVLLKQHDNIMKWLISFHLFFYQMPRIIVKQREIYSLRVKLLQI